MFKKREGKREERKKRRKRRKGRKRRKKRKRKEIQSSVTIEVKVCIIKENSYSYFLITLKSLIIVQSLITVHVEKKNFEINSRTS